ncbi:venom serine protease inhibitor-like [Andrena cerasifolii]|uniref:venom serine protease inhibitor-like n=1 Tax=Andrena cerasifolii TaxID=2819439 RepID=UPI0040383939
MYRYVVLSLLLVAVAYANEVTTSTNIVPPLPPCSSGVQCPVNEHWSDCGRICEPSCENPNGKWNGGFCPVIRDVSICRRDPACICVTNYVRNSWDVCVPRSTMCET